MVYKLYLADFGRGFNAESFIDFVTVALTDEGKLKVKKPHDAYSLIAWYREHANKLEKATPR